MNYDTRTERAAVRVVTDSVACLPRHLVSLYGIHVIPVRVTVAEQVYRDVDEELPAAVVHELQRATAIDTTPWPPDVYRREYLEAGRASSNLIHIVAFSQFTSTMSLARAGAAMAHEADPELNVEIFDSATTGMAQGFIALAAARAAAQGGSITAVLAAAETVKARVESAFILDSLQHLARTGRVNRMKAWAGTLLNVKPVVALSQGKERPIALARSRAQGIRRLLELARNSPGNAGPLHIAVMESDRVLESEELRQTIDEQLRPAECLVARVSGVTQIVAGPGLLGVAFYRDG